MGEPLMPPVRPMVARPATALPDEQQAARLAFEPKFDGSLTELHDAVSASGFGFCAVATGPE
jgi:hypothetical protein